MDRRVCHGLTRCFNCAVFEQVLAMHIHNSWFQQLRILWVWTIELSWADAMLYLSCVRTSLGYESACRLSASEIQEQQSRSCPLYVPKTLHLRQVFHNRRSRCSVSKYTEWKHEKRIQQLARLPKILGDDFRARCNSLYLQPLGSTTPSLRSTDYQVCHHFCLLKVFHWCPVSYSMPGECKACWGTQGEHTKQDMRQWIQQLRIWEVPLERSFTP